MTDELLPALPKPVSDFKLYPVFTEDQMRAYAREAIRLSHTWPTLRDDAALAALPGGGVACGGCGETDAAKRCIGCLHQFAPTWRPIETAPERGSFLIYGGEWVGESGRRYKSEIAQVNRANGGKFYLADAEDFWPWVESATHWMPSPQAPVIPTPNPHEADRNG